jgi:hypothetical protein
MANHPKRAGQRFYSNSIRRQALTLAASGAAPVEVARRLGVNRSTVRSWLHRARYAPTRRSLAERDALADQAERELAGMRAAVASGNPAAVLAAATRASAAMEAAMLADGTVPPEVAARLTVDPWTGEPIRRVKVPR